MYGGKFHYVYLTTNLINGKQYIGDRTTLILPDKYLGSGYNLKKAIKRYGRNNFKKEILQFFSNRELAFKAQEQYIKKYNTLIPNGYNLSVNGGVLENKTGILFEKRVYVYDRAGYYRYTFESGQKAALALHTSVSSISACLHGRVKTAPTRLLSGETINKYYFSFKKKLMYHYTLSKKEAVKIVYDYVYPGMLELYYKENLQKCFSSIEIERLKIN